tara:strand:- start:298 stop:483 length:186 start_codon:yes stop_codon:yes gene_type:complete
MTLTSSLKFYKEDQTKILYVHIYAQTLTRLDISINKWWKTRYPEYKIRVVSKNEFEKVKIK